MKFWVEPDKAAHQERDIAQMLCKSRPADARDAEIGRLQAKVGELTMTTELLEAKIEHLETHRPLAHRRSRR